MSDLLSQRLRDVRKSLNLTAAAMAERVGLKNRQSWEQYERNKTSPKADVLSRLVMLGIDVNWLLTGEGTMSRQEQGIDEAFFNDVTEAAMLWTDENGLELPKASMGRSLLALYYASIEEKERRDGDFSSADLHTFVSRHLTVARSLNS